MGYVEDSVSNKKKICAQISSCVNLNPPEANIVDSQDLGASTSRNSAIIKEKENLFDLTNFPKNDNISVNLSNCQVTFNFAKQ